MRHRAPFIQPLSSRALPCRCRHRRRHDRCLQCKNWRTPATEEVNLVVVCVLLEDADDAKVQGAAAALASGRGESGSIPRFDLIISHLTLHHIPSLPAILATMFQCLKPGGWIALTDFEDFGPDAVIFHPKSKREGVERHEIKRNEMEIMINSTGFDQVKVETAFTFTKEVEDEDGGPKKEMSFPFLICMGRKA